MEAQDMVVLKPMLGNKKRTTSPRHRQAAHNLFDPHRTKGCPPTLQKFMNALYPDVPCAVAFAYSFPDSSPQYPVYSDINIYHHEECTTSTHPPPPLSKIVSGMDSSDALIDRLSLTLQDPACIEEATRGQSICVCWEEGPAQCPHHSLCLPWGVG